jgi:hypothetical protein
MHIGLFVDQAHHPPQLQSSYLFFYVLLLVVARKRNDFLPRQGSVYNFFSDTVQIAAISLN